MQDTEILPNLFRTEYSKIVAVLGKLLGFEQIEIAKDITSETFLLAAESWGQKGLPLHPTAWLYTVAKNKTIDYLKRLSVYRSKVTPAWQNQQPESFELDLSIENIRDSQLAMMFTICHPAISVESQICLSLHLLCGFGVEEISNALLSNKEAIYKKLTRARQRLQQQKAILEIPSNQEMKQRLDTVLTTLYLLFSEGYYSSSHQINIRKDLCLEAIRLALLLTEKEITNLPEVNALLALMCFHASRFDSRFDHEGEIILYDQQDTDCWNYELIEKGNFYLNIAAKNNQVTRYHLEAAIAYWHTQKDDTIQKWENILHLYNQLLQIHYSPISALNRTYALSKVAGYQAGIHEAEKLQLNDNHFYHSLLGHLYAASNPAKAIIHFNHALSLAKSNAQKNIISRYIQELT